MRGVVFYNWVWFVPTSESEKSVGNHDEPTSLAPISTLPRCVNINFLGLNFITGGSSSTIDTIKGS